MSVQDSSSSTSTNSLATQQHEWDVTGSIPDKPSNWAYGYVINRKMVGTTREQLSELFVKHGSEISFVWTPEHPRLVFPEQVPFLLDAFRRGVVRNARNAFLLGAALVGAGVLVAVIVQDWRAIYRNLFYVFGAIALSEGIVNYARSRRYTQEDAASDAGTVRFANWLQKKRISGYTFTLAGCIVVVSLLQVPFKDSIQLAGLVKPAVRDGEIWRLFTSTLMHGSFTHFWMNFYALLHFSKIVEQTLHRSFVPLVFLFSGAVGSVFSVLLYPNATSIGASGGLMGLLGFITMAAHFDRNKYPPKYLRQNIEAIVLVGAFGLFGFAFIDNAGHLGGLVGGLFLGLLLLRRNGQRSKAQERLLQIGTLGAFVALVVIAVYAVYRMLG